MSVHGWTVHIEHTLNNDEALSIVRVLESESSTSSSKIVEESLQGSIMHSEEESRFTYPISFVHGIAYPKWCPQSRWQYLNQNIHLRENDIIIVTYPKCGTTWIEQCVLLLQHRGDVSKMDPSSKNTYTPARAETKSGSAHGKIWPEACIEQNPSVYLQSGPEFIPLTIDEFDQAPSPRIIKSHAPPHLLPTGRRIPPDLTQHADIRDGPDSKSISGAQLSLPEGVKVIVVTRNPLDACVSSYYHAWNPCKSGWPFSAWAAAWLSGLVPHGSWFEWVKAWNREALANPAQILWLQFEDVKSDPFKVTRQIAQFLSPPLSVFDEVGSGGDGEDIIAAVVQASSFEAMKEQASGRDSGAAQGHLRKGVIGDWRNHFSEPLKDEFLVEYHRLLAGSGLVYCLGQREDGTEEMLSASVS